MTKTPALVLALSIALALPAYAQTAPKVVKTLDFTKSSPYSNPATKPAAKPAGKKTETAAAKKTENTKQSKKPAQTIKTAKPAAGKDIKQKEAKTAPPLAQRRREHAARTAPAKPSQPALAGKTATKRQEAPLFSAAIKSDKTAKAANPSRAQASAQPVKNSARQSIIAAAQKTLGTPYRWGGSTPKGFDCSGLTSYLYHQKGISLPRTARAQFASLTPVKTPQPGDLVFFRHKSGRISHVGLYIGGGKMIHAPQSGERVRIESIEKPNWKRRYAGARSILPRSSAVQMVAERQKSGRANDGQLFSVK